MHALGHIPAAGDTVELTAFDTDAPPDEQPFVVREPTPHKDAKPDVTTFGMLVAFPSAEDAEAFRAIRSGQFQEIVNKVLLVPGRKRKSDDAYKVMVSLPGVDPADPPESTALTSGQERLIELGPDGHYIDVATGKAQHFCAWLKVQMAPPKDIVELQTKFYKLSAPGEPFSCTPIDGASVDKGARVMAVAETSELKDLKGKQGFVLYTKYVFVGERPPRAPDVWEGEVVIPGNVCEFAASGTTTAVPGGLGSSCVAEPSVVESSFDPTSQYY